jgi:predicted dehydrogenase
MKPIKTGLLGYGAVAHMHMKALAQCPERVVTGVYGPNPEKAEAFARQYGITAFPTRQALLEANDCIHVCTPTGTHYRDILDCFAANCHALVEKPLCMTDEECDLILEAAKKATVQIMPVSQYRYSPTYAAVKKAADSGAFGKLLSANVKMMYYRSPEYYRSAPWRGTVKEDGGVLMTQALHGIDVTLGIMGKPVWVAAMAQTMFHDIEAPDTAIALVGMENGAAVIFETSTASAPGYPRQYCFSGTNGAVEMLEETIARWDIPGKEELTVPMAGGQLLSGASDPMNLDSSLHAAQFTDFSNQIRGIGKPHYTLEEGIGTVKLINAIFRSQNEDRKVRL